MTPTARFVPWASAVDLHVQWERMVRRMMQLPHVMEVASAVRAGATPSEAVFQRDKVTLLRFVPEDGHEFAFSTPLVFVFALVNRPYILDLRPGKSVVHHFVDAGFDTYNVDWGVPSAADRHRGMHDYVDGYVDDIVEYVRQDTGAEKVNILGYCMGGSMSAMYTALHPEKVKNLILLAAPVDWSNRDHLLAKWTDPAVFDVDRFVDTLGNAPADMLQGSFLLLKPITNLIEKYVSFYENMEDDQFLEDFFAMETWLNDNIPIAGEMFREFVKHCMQENRLIDGRLRIGGKLVELKNISCPVLNLAAEHDHLVPCGQSLPFTDAVGSTDRKTITFPSGHIGLAVGSKANRELWPEVVSWLGDRSVLRT